MNIKIQYFSVAILALLYGCTASTSEASTTTHVTKNNLRAAEQQQTTGLIAAKEHSTILETKEKILAFQKQKDFQLDAAAFCNTLELEIGDCIPPPGMNHCNDISLPGPGEYRDFGIDVEIPMYIHMVGGGGTITSLTVLTNTEPFYFNLTDEVVGTGLPLDGTPVSASVVVPVDLTQEKTYTFLGTVAADILGGQVECHTSDAVTFELGITLPPLFPPSSSSSRLNSNNQYQNSAIAAANPKEEMPPSIKISKLTKLQELSSNEEEMQVDTTCNFFVEIEDCIVSATGSSCNDAITAANTNNNNMKELDVTIPLAIKVTKGSITVSDMTVTASFQPHLFDMTQDLAGTIVSVDTPYIVPVSSTIHFNGRGRGGYDMIATVSALTPEGRKCSNVDMIDFYV